jgi:hypothetical protein
MDLQYFTNLRILLKKKVVIEELMIDLKQLEASTDDPEYKKLLIVKKWSEIDLEKYALQRFQKETNTYVK